MDTNEKIATFHGVRTVYDLAVYDAMEPGAANAAPITQAFELPTGMLQRWNNAINQLTKHNLWLLATGGARQETLPNLEVWLQTQPVEMREITDWLDEIFA